MFKKVVTGDELSVEEKYKPRYTIKPVCKFIWGTNNLPQLEQIADEGFYRRINILPFDKKISKEAEHNFDKSKILTPEALDYLANIALRAYLEIKDTHLLANEKENVKMVNEYRKSNNSVEAFIRDDEIIKEMFFNDNRVLKTAFYCKYLSWCKSNKFFFKNKKDFYQEVLNDENYEECKLDGKDFFRNINEDLKNDINLRNMKF